MNEEQEGKEKEVLVASDDFSVPEDMVIVDEGLRSRVEDEAHNERDTLAPVPSPLPEEVAYAEEVVGLSPDLVRSAPSVLESVSNRDSVRLLICTKSTSILQEGSVLQARLLELSGLFAEIHVIVLSLGKRTDRGTYRLADNVWVYTTESGSMIGAAYDAYTIAKEQLTFAGGFRADLVIAEDPFEAGAVGYYIAKKYERPFQVHFFEDIFDPEFKTRDPHNGLRLHLAHFILSRTASVRTQSDGLRREIIERYPRIGEGVETLPLYHNLSLWRDLTPEFDLKDRYPNLKFVILHVSNMTVRSHTKEVIDGVLPLIRMYPTIGLLIVGNGPLRPQIEKYVTELGIAGKVVFEPKQSVLISHMKSAHVLVHLSEDSEEDVTLLEAASVKLPIIGLGTGLAGTLFKNGESAFLTEAPDPNSVSQYLRMFLNDNSARVQFAQRAEEIVFERIEQDYGAYLQAFRTSIEKAL